MNKLEVNQVGGFPMTTRILDEIQKAHAVFNGLGALAGDMTIISGCKLEGSTVGDGVVYLNGEVFEFRGGIAQTKVKVVEEVENLVFQNNNSNPVIKTRYVTFGTGIGAVNWADFKRLIETKVIPTDIVSRLDALEKKSAVFQAGGGMILWNKPAADIPAGWQEVVDWRGRMPVGFDASQSDFNAMGKTGGAKNKKLALTDLPEIQLKLFSEGNTSTTSEVTSGTYPVVSSYGSGWGNDSYRIRGSETPPTLGLSSKIGGANNEFSMLNPYRTVLFIEYIG